MRSVNFSGFSHFIRWTVALAIAILPQAARGQWHATVGAQSANMGRQALAFLPNEIWIHEGDDITWTSQSDDIHTATFLIAPQLRPPPRYNSRCHRWQEFSARHQ